MAEGNPAPQNEASTPSAKSSGEKPTKYIILVVVNLAVVLAVGAMLYLGKKKEEKDAKIEDVIQGEASTQKEELEKEDFIGNLIPMETFLVNLSGSRGTKVAKINMEFEVSNADVQEEIDKLKPKIRDIIIIILSSKNYAQVSSKQGKDTLRTEIRDQVNLFLTKGQIRRVYFTEFIFN